MLRRLPNVPLLIIAVALGSYLTYQNVKSTPVTVKNYADYWEFSSHHLNQSRWTYGPPPMSQSQALETSRLVVDSVTKRNAETGYQNFELQSVALLNLESENSWWAYRVFISANAIDNERGWYHLSFLLLMDGRLAFDATNHSPAIIDAMRDFGSKNGVEIIWTQKG